MKDAQAPSLVAPKPHAPADSAPAGEARSLAQLLHPGFYMVFLLRNGHAPADGAADGAAFREQVRRFLADVEQGAQRLSLAAADVAQARFAFCALLDEVVLESALPLRAQWECRPLQLEFFGEHMAGERFFERLESLRREGAARVAVLEIFHLCLLLGFKGRYVLEGAEKLDWFTARLGDEIVHLQGRRAPFAPHWAAPDHVVHRLRGELPLWAMGAVFGALTLGAFLGLRLHLDHATEQDLARYADVVQPAPRAAHVTITLP